ncbi:hypothetical protein GCM10010232_16290 [Streptomyces amakusaensis]|uniref:AfsR/SARP family transcriptional regulator n=1 Tax=Streptomyces amakusaensis TaxID=67271 RepID=A0ABW0AHY9_9ACTN
MSLFVEAKLLGEFSVSVNGQRLYVPAQKQRVLLALLLAEAPRSVSLEQLVGYLWDDDRRPHNERGALHIHMARLRHALARADRRLNVVIRTEEGSYRVVCDRLDTDLTSYQDWCAGARVARQSGDDTAERRCIEQALALWQGELLEDVPAAAAYDRTRLQLRERQLDLTERLHELRIAGGEPGCAVADLRRLVAVHPLRENTWYLLMKALLEAGRSAEAVATFSTARNVFVKELGVEPGVQLRALFEEVLAA